MLPSQVSRPNQKTRRRAVRIEDATESQDLHHENESWAVSYADFLMVLLSFFILFFSIDHNKKKNVIEQILLETKGTGGGVSPQEASSTISPRSPSGKPRNLDMSEITGRLANLSWKVEQKSKKVIIHFPENIFPPGTIAITNSAKENLDEVFELLTPFLNDIEITFIGHTDDIQLRHRDSDYLKDNFDLSVLRATNALKYATQNDIPIEILGARGKANLLRNTRSLSLVIEQKEADE